MDHFQYTWKNCWAQKNKTTQLKYFQRLEYKEAEYWELRRFKILR